MDVYHKTTEQAEPQVSKNPTDSQRYEMVRNALTKAGRPEDSENVIKLMSPPPDITNYGAPGQYKGIKVAVVGAGVAGLASAFELRKLGFDITIFESEDRRIGGRIYTHYFDRYKQLYGEFGALRIPASHETSWHYINMFKLNTSKLASANPNTFVYVRGVRARNNPKEIQDKIYPLFDLTPSERNTPWPQLYNNVVQSALKSLSPELRTEIASALPKYSPEFLRVIVGTVRQALLNAGLSQPAVSLITSLIPVANAFINASLSNEFNTEYLANYSDLYRVDGGMVNLPLAFYNSLNSQNPDKYNIPQSALGKVTFKMGAWVTGAFKSDTDGKVTLKYLTRLQPEGSFQTFDYVVFAVPLTALRKMHFIPQFSPLKMEAIREVNYIDAQKTLFLCNERFWEGQGIFCGASYTDLIIQSVIYPPDRPYCEQNTSGGNLDYNPNMPGVLTASYNMGNDAVRLGNTQTFRFELLKKQLEAVHGLPEKYLNSIVIDYKTVDWNRNEWITGAFVNLVPLQGTFFFFEMSKPDYNNRAYFAGEAYTQPHGWIQAALSTGMLAANALAYYLKTQGHK